MYSRFICMGRIASEFKTFNEDKNPFINFSIAVERDYKDKNGNKTADFFRCNASGKVQEIFQKYVKKGGLVHIEGRLQISKYINKEGVPMETPIINVNSVALLPNHRNSASEEGSNDITEAEVVENNDEAFDFNPDSLDYEN